LVTVAKSIIGIAAAARFSPEDLIVAGTYGVPLVVAIGITGGLSILNGYLIGRWTEIGLATSLLGSVPGTASAVVAISGEFGADPASVAILQYLRMIIVVLLVPIAASFFSSDIAVIPNAVLPTSVANSQRVSTALNLLLLTVGCSLGTLAGKGLRLPTGEFLGSFLVGLGLCWILRYQLYIPRPLFVIGLLLIGLSAGLKFDWQVMFKLWKAVLLEIVLVVLLVLCCLGIGYEFHLITQVDTTTALLAFAPGGMEAMIATANQLGSDTGLVLTIKFIRQLIILVTLNAWKLYFNTTKCAEG
jgi:hypothetical protein